MNSFKLQGSKQFIRLHNAAFTLLEVMVAASILAVLISGSIATMVYLNRFAAATRLQTLALGIVQERIDQVLTVPWKMKSRPALLAETAVTDVPAVLPPAGGDAIVLNDDPLNTSPSSPLDTPIPARRYIYVKNVGLHSVRVTVIVAYTARSRPYTVSQTTLRSSDDI